MFHSKKIELNLLVTLIMLFFLRMAVPFMIYLFIPYFILFSGYFIVKYWNISDKMKHLGIIAKVFLPFLVISGILIIAYIFSTVKPLLILKDILHIVVVISLLIVLFLEIKNTLDYKQFERYFSIQIIAFSLVISMLGLFKFYLYLSGFTPNFIGEITPYCTALTSDYNFYCLASIIGFIFVCRILLNKSITRRVNGLMQVVLFIISLNIVLSNSRRGLTIFIVFLIIIVLFNIYKYSKIKYKGISFRLYLVLMGIFISLLSLFFITNINQKFIIARMLNLEISSLTNSTSRLVLRYSTILELNNNSDDIIKSINDEPDSRYPFTGWGSRVHNDVFPLVGKNAEIVPKDAIGYKMDSKSNPSVWDNNAYSFTSILSLFQGDVTQNSLNYYYASVYCYVSEDFDGTWIRIIAVGNYLFEYDILKKGTWQKLQIEFTSTTGIPNVYLYWAKYGVTDFKTLKGYVIFAYPEYKKISKPQTHLKLNNKNIKFNKANIQASIISSVFISDFFKKLRQLIKSNEVLTDTTLIKNDNFIIKIEDELVDPRTERWRYGWYLFKNKYSWQKKVFGNGFSYFEDFGKKFGGQYDWPHNPIISTFLYSGILGGFAFIWFLIMVIVNYIIYLKQHIFFFISFCVTFFFVFFSDFSLFNTPMFAFLCIIPFFTKYLSLKEEYGDINNIPIKRFLLW